MDFERARLQESIGNEDDIDDEADLKKSSEFIKSELLSDVESLRQERADKSENENAVLSGFTSAMTDTDCGGEMPQGAAAPTPSDGNN